MQKAYQLARPSPMLKTGIIRHSKSAWSNPFFFEKNLMVVYAFLLISVG